MITFTRVFVIAASLIISGCAQFPNKLTSEMRQSVKSIAIEVVLVAENPTIYTPEQEFAGLSEFIILGSMAMNEKREAVAKGPAAFYGKFLQEHKISIKDIVEKELMKQLKAAQLFTVTNKSKADILLKARITGYGFAQSGIMTAQQMAHLYIYADIYNRNDQMIAQNVVGFASTLGDRPTFTAEKIFANPNISVEQFATATEIAVKDIIERLSSE